MSPLALLLALSAATSSGAPERVLLISIDGLRADALTVLGPKKTPTLHRLMREGAGTLNARADPVLTYTVPNHLCMVTGRLATGAEGHGYRENSYRGMTLHQVRRRYLFSAFDVVHDRGFRVAMAASKPKFALLRASWDGVHGAADRIPPDHGRRKLDQATVTSDDGETLQATMQLLRITTPPRLIFVHFAGPDLAGHTHGFDVSSPDSEYLQEIERQDRHLGRILFAIGSRKSLRDSTTIILTSDHGGDGERHTDADRLENYRIPFLVWGAGVREGEDLYDLNRGVREDPKEEKQGDKPPIRNCDAGNLALSLLDLPPIPGSTVNAQQDLAVR